MLGADWKGIENFVGLTTPNDRFDSCDEIRATVLNEPYRR